MNRDIRMLILYKQHYMDQYKRPLTECQYSCWGYYDGMSIIEVNRIESRLFEKNQLLQYQNYGIMQWKMQRV